MFFGTLCSGYLLKIVGRKTILLASLGISLATLIIITVSFKLCGANNCPSTVNWDLIKVSYFINVLTYGTLGPIVMIYASEILPYKVIFLNIYFCLN